MERNLISWTALISGYVRSGCGEQAVDMFLEILDQGIRCDSVLVGFMETNKADDEDAMVLFRQLRLNGMKPDFVTFSRLLVYLPIKLV
ncbi:hypothetical protein CRYUN_Cryun08bG0096500 [Craigia yunnanensis]